MNHGLPDRLQHAQRSASAQIPRHRDGATGIIHNRPAELIKRVAQERNFLRIIGQQMRADPIHGGRVVAAQDESQVERLGLQRTIALAGKLSRLGVTEQALLAAYPALRAEDLVNAWYYARAHAAEIEAQIRENEAA